MKKTTFLVLTLFVLNSFGQDKTNKTVLSKINKLERRVDSVKVNIDSIKQDESSMFLIKNIILKKSSEHIEMRRRILDMEEGQINWVSKNFKIFASIIASFVSVILLLISYSGYKSFLSKYEKKIKDEVDEKVKIEVDKVTNSKIETLNKELDQIDNHTKYRKEAKILIITEGTSTPQGFDKVMKLFKNSDGSEIKIEEIENLEKLKDYYPIFKKYDLLILENNDVEKWVLDETNNQYLKELANNICDTTSIIYFGSGRFPNVDSKYQHMVTYANAPSQLYGNMLNMLKFQNELKRAR